jgi:type II secretory pathway pseudopilin PulG
MIVVALIAVMATILIPSLMSVRERTAALKMEMRIRELDEGIRDYKEQTRSFPGQLDRNGWRFFTGSQVLAAVLFEYGYKNIQVPDPPVLNNYVEIDEGDLFEYQHEARRNSLSDRHPTKRMPILYYPSRMDVYTGVDQYVYTDNSAYFITSGQNENCRWLDQEKFLRWITDWRASKDKDTGPWDPKRCTPYNPREFLLISAGVDRLYGTKDDINNW